MPFLFFLSKLVVSFVQLACANNNNKRSAIGGLKHLTSAHERQFMGDVRWKEEEEEGNKTKGSVEFMASCLQSVQICGLYVASYTQHVCLELWMCCE